MANVVAGSLRNRRLRQKMREAPILAFLFLCALVTIVTTVGIVIVLLAEAVQFFREVSVVEFLTGTEWTPLFSIKNFGVLPAPFGDSPYFLPGPEHCRTGRPADRRIPERVRSGQGTVNGKAGAGGARGHPYGGLRFLCYFLYQ